MAGTAAAAAGVVAGGTAAGRVFPGAVAVGFAADPPGVVGSGFAAGFDGGSDLVAETGCAGWAGVTGCATGLAVSTAGLLASVSGGLLTTGADAGLASAAGLTSAGGFVSAAGSSALTAV